MVNSRCRRGSGPRPSLRQIHEEKHKKAALCLLGAISGVMSVLGHVEAHANKRPMHTSAQTGQKWLDELLVGGYFSLFLWHMPKLIDWDVPYFFVLE